MSFGQFLSILKARWWAALLVFVLTVGTTVAVSLLLPKQYTAAASVVVDFKPDPVTAMMYAGMTSSGYMATQVDVILSERVALRVVRNLKLADNAASAPAVAGRHRRRGQHRKLAGAAFPEAAGRQALARIERDHGGLQGPRPAVRRRRGQRVRAGLFANRAGTARRSGQAVLQLLRQPRQGRARHAGESAVEAVGLPEGKRHHRHRRAAGRGNRAAERTVFPGGDAAGTGQRSQQPPDASARRFRRQDAGGAEQPARSRA